MEDAPATLLPPVAAPGLARQLLGSGGQDIVGLVPWWVDPSRRVLAALQVILVCGIPTQVVILVAFFFAGQPLPLDAHVPLAFFASFSLFDTALIALLIKLFLALSGESSSTVFLGRSPLRREALLGLALLPVVFVVVQGMVWGLDTLFPALHNVPKSPLADYMRTPVDAAIFVVVVILAGGVREELQRAFILHRFEQSLGGARVGLTLFSLLFAALHLEQGFDAALAVGTLGVLWGWLYIRRGSAVAAMVNHAGFDSAQVVLAALGSAFSR